MSKDTTQTTSDIYSTYKQNVVKYFENFEKIVPQYFQSLISLQEEYIKAWEKGINSTISIQQDIARKSGFATQIPEITKKAIVDTNKQFVQASTVQNQIAQTTINAAIQSVKTFNDNANSFADLNRNFVQSWISTFTQPRS